MCLFKVLAVDDELHVHLTHTLVKGKDVDVRFGKSFGGSGKESGQLHVAADDADDRHFTAGDLCTGELLTDLFNALLEILGTL